MRVCFLSTYLPKRYGTGILIAPLAQTLSNDGDIPRKFISEYGALAGHCVSVTPIPSCHRGQDYGPDIFGMDERVICLIQQFREREISLSEQT